MESPTPSHRDLLGRVYSAFRRILSTVGKQRFRFLPFRPDDEPSLIAYNDIRQTIAGDLSTCQAEINAISGGARETFNISLLLTGELEALAAEAAQKVQDVSILTGVGDQDVLVAGDSFNDRFLVDDGLVSSAPKVYIDTQQGIATLARETFDSVIPPESEIIIESNYDDNEVPPEGNIERFYEGKFYALAGQAEPEGGKWHLEEQARYDGAGYTETFHYKRTGTGKASRTIEYEEVTTDNEEGPANTLEFNDILIRDRGATEEEKKRIRKRMIDGNPDTYWQSEYVVRPLPLGQDLRGDSGVTPESPEEAETNGDPRAGVTAESLREAAKEQDTKDLEITVTINMPSPQVMNWLSLNPMNFGETAWVQISDVSTAETHSSEFSQIPGFDRQIFQNILTDDVNAEVSANKADYTLSPSRFSYRGLGVWTFPARQVQVIRFKVLQTTPTPVLYQRYHVQLKRLEDTTTVKTYSSSSRSWVSTKDRTKEWTRIIKLDYLQTIQVHAGATAIEALTGPTQPDSDSFHSSHTSDSGYTVLDFLGLGNSSSRTHGINENTQDSGWYIQRYWLQTYYDLIGYRIGIKELAGFRHLYALSSELVSRRFTSPSPIRKVTLHVDDAVPINTSINYYISPDDGTNWHQINPLDKPSLHGEGGFSVPRIIVFNQPGNPPNEQKYLQTEDPVTQIRLRAILRSSNDDVTPVVKSYRMLLYPEERLRRQDVSI